MPSLAHLWSLTIVRRVLLLAGVLAAGLTLAGPRAMSEVSACGTTDIAAVAAGGAIVVRTCRDGRDRIERVSATGAVLWTRSLPGSLAKAGRHALVHGDATFVRYVRDDAMVVSAFALSDGASRWETRVARLLQQSRWHRQEAPFALTASEDLVLVSAEHDHLQAVAAVAIRDGQLRWRREHVLDGAPTASPGGFVTADDGAMIDDAGQEHAFARRSANCFAGDVLLALRGAEGNRALELVMYRSTRQVAVSVPVTYRRWAVTSIDGCAVAAGKVIAAVTWTRDDEGATEHDLFILDRALGFERQIAVDPSYAAWIRLRGVLPRFVPLVHEADARLALFDLRRGVFAWTANIGIATDDHEVTLLDGRWYLASASSLIVIDGTSGELTGSAAIEGADVRIDRDRLAGGALWLAASRPRAGAPRIAALDAATLAIRFRDGVRVRLVTDDTRRAWFGEPRTAGRPY